MVQCYRVRRTIVQIGVRGGYSSSWWLRGRGKNLFIFDENGENLLIFSLKKKVITFPRVSIRGKFGNLEGKWDFFL